MRMVYRKHFFRVFRRRKLFKPFVSVPLTIRSNAISLTLPVIRSLSFSTPIIRVLGENNPFDTPIVRKISVED